MTRLLLLAQPAMLLLLVSTSTAEQITVGLRAGASMSDLAVTGIVIDDQDPRRGYTVGAAFSVPLSQFLGFRIGAAYIQRGSTSTLLQLGEVDHRIHYLRFSALGRATAPLPGPLSLYVVGGPAVALETSCERETRLALQPVTILIGCDDPESGAKTKPIDFGLVGGGGLQFAPSDRIRLSVEVLYTRGIRSILESAQDYTAQNRSLEIHAGVDLPIG